MLVVILEVRVGAVGYEQLHDFIALLVVDKDGREVEGGLTGLRLEPVHQTALVVAQKGLYFLVGAD